MHRRGFVTYTEPRSYVNVQNFAQRGCWPAHFRMTLLRKRYLLSTPRALSNWLHASFHAFYSTNRLSFHLDIDCAYQRVNPTDSQWSPSMNRVIHRSRHLSCVNQRRTSASDSATSNIPFLFALRRGKKEKCTIGWIKLIKFLGKREECPLNPLKAFEREFGGKWGIFRFWFLYFFLLFFFSFLDRCLNRWLKRN